MAINTNKLQFWTGHFDNWQASGLTQRAYCAREGLSLSTFDHWRRQSRRLAQDQISQEPKKAPSRQGLTLVPVRLDATVGEIQLRSPAGWQIALPATVEPDMLVRLLSQLP